VAIERANALAGELAMVIAVRDAKDEQVKSLAADAKLRDDEVSSLQSAADDLSRQVQGLLRQLAIRDDPLLANVPIDRPAPEGDVITDHLLEFKSLRGLQEQNVKLLKLTRALMAKLEQREVRRATAEESDIDTADSLDQAAETIDKLHKQLLDANKKINEATRERDFFSKLLARGEGLKWSAAATSEDAAAPHQQTIEALRVEIEGVRVKAEEELLGVRDELKSKLREVGEAEIGKARAEAKVSMLEGESGIAAPADW
jgi:nucleoprotein TPR